jgi:hypothetical protein
MNMTLCEFIFMLGNPFKGTAFLRDLRIGKNEEEKF